MVCIYCGQKTAVINSRRQKRRNTTWRRRECSSCKAVFTSVEAPDLASTLLVQKSTKHVQPFQRDIMMLSIYESLKHRKNAVYEAGELSDTALQRIIAETKGPIIKITTIKGTVEDILKKFDQVAAVHYRAYFLD